MSIKQTLVASGYSEFEAIRSKGLLYIDKTIYIDQLLSNAHYKNWFLARPRRFGKTLFVDTLVHFFRGSEELFQGLAIHAKGYDFKPCPVIRLNMARSASSPNELKSAIISHLERIAISEKLTLKNDIPAEALESLIIDIKEKYGDQKVAVLIDEYDKPILDHINKPNLAEDLRDTLRDFYISLKNSENYLRFVFVTGISKFAKTAIHSSLNNLHDITLDQEFAGICGFTEKELISNFSPLFDDLLSELISSKVLKKEADHKSLIDIILKKYNGYSWDGRTKVLNPYSINNFFSTKKLANFWMQTGPPMMLAHVMSEDPTAFLVQNLQNIQQDKLDETEIGDLTPISVLFQTGYLTVDTVTIKPHESFDSSGNSDDGVDIEYLYSLKIPNKEVLKLYKNSLFTSLFPLLNSTNIINNCRNDITNYILAKNSNGLTEILHSQLARVTYHQHTDFQKQWGSTPEHGEFLFHSIFQSFFDGLGLMVIPEASSSRGRSDIDIILPNNNFAVIEIKYIPAKETEDIKDTEKDKKTKRTKLTTDIAKIMEKKAIVALNQLADTLQAEKYQNKGQIISVGIVIYGRDRVLVKFADSLPVFS